MISIKIGDITKEDVDVIVNAANKRLQGGGGVDGAIHRAAGPSVMEECRKMGYCAVGEAVITNAGNLQVKKIIHTVGPVWKGGKSNEANDLRCAYQNSFKLAKEFALETIAFPAISTGVYRYPKKKATEIAIGEGIKFEKDFKDIKFICFSGEDFKLYKEIYEAVKKGELL